MTLSRIILSVCFLFLIAGVALAQKVSVDFDKTVDFSQYKTYAWVEGASATNPLVHQRIIDGVEARLAAKGLRRVETNPDLIIMYSAALDAQVSVNTMGTGPFGGWRMGSGTATVDRVPVGQLMIDIGDMNARRFVWRGTASGTLSSKAEKNEKALNEAINKMFQNFPQAPGKAK